MMGIKLDRILVAKDLSRESSHVVRYALELASKFDAEVHVLHVMPTVDSAVLNMVAISMGPDKLAKLNAANEKEMAEKTRQQLKDMLDKEKQLAPFELKKEPHVEVHHGEAAPVILSVADRIDADLILLGSHSKGKLHYAFLGSVAEKILRKAQRAVFIVPPEIGE
jgi:nucleotide-binding universal stress UspA family protein